MKPISCFLLLPFLCLTGCYTFHVGRHINPERPPKSFDDDDVVLIASIAVQEILENGELSAEPFLVSSYSIHIGDPRQLEGFNFTLNVSRSDSENPKYWLDYEEEKVVYYLAYKIPRKEFELYGYSAHWVKFHSRVLFNSNWDSSIPITLEDKKCIYLGEFLFTQLTTKGYFGTDVEDIYLTLSNQWEKDQEIFLNKFKFLNPKEVEFLELDISTSPSPGKTEVLSVPINLL